MAGGTRSGAGCERRRLLELGASSALFFVASRVAAQEVAVPISVQADLLAKVAAYDRNLVARAGSRVSVAIVSRPGNVISDRAATQMKKALEEAPHIAGLPHVEEVTPVEDAAQISVLCRARRPSIVYVGPGYTEDEVRGVARGLDGVDILSCGAVATYVTSGMVLGFDLVSGRPKLLVNLTQARKQNVALRAEALKLMRVIE